MHSKKSGIHQTSVEGFAFLLLSVLLAVYSLVLHVGSKAKWKMSPYLFPLVIAAFLFLLSLSLLQEGKKERKAQEEKTQEKQGHELQGKLPYAGPFHGEKEATQKLKGSDMVGSLKQMPWKDSVVFALLSMAYMISIAFVGFVVSTVLFLAFSFVYLKERRIWLILVLSLTFPLIVYILFGMLLHVMLP